MTISAHAIEAATLVAAILPEGAEILAAVEADSLRGITKILRRYRAEEGPTRPRNDSREARVAVMALGIVLDDAPDAQAMARLRDAIA